MLCGFRGSLSLFTQEGRSTKSRQFFPCYPIPQDLLRLKLLSNELFALSLRNAIIGAAIWVVLYLIPLSDSFEGDLIQRILLLGVLVIVPLGLALISSISQSRSRFFRFAVLLHRFGALAVVVSALLGAGPAAAALASLWLLVTGLIALDGLIGLFRLRQSDLPVVVNASLLAGMIFLPVGASWLVMSRLGIQAFGFGDTIVVLTAVHFHFAGFAAPLLAALTGNHLQSSNMVQRLLVVTVACIIAGTPLVAAGITVSPALALIGAVIISLGLHFLALLNLVWVVPSLAGRLPKALLIISSLASVPAMLLAAVYAYSIVFQRLIVDIPQMAMTHGVANAFGFALCGMGAWVLISKERKSVNGGLV